MYLLVFRHSPELRAFEEAAKGPLGDRAGSGVDARHCGLARLAPMIRESDLRYVWFLFRNMQRPKARIWRHRFRWFRLPWGESAPEPQSGARRLAYAQAGYAARREMRDVAAYSGRQASGSSNVRFAQQRTFFENAIADHATHPSSALSIYSIGPHRRRQRRHSDPAAQ